MSSGSVEETLRGVARGEVHQSAIERSASATKRRNLASGRTAGFVGTMRRDLLAASYLQADERKRVAAAADCNPLAQCALPSVIRSIWMLRSSNGRRPVARSSPQPVGRWRLSFADPGSPAFAMMVQAAARH